MGTPADAEIAVAIVSCPPTLGIDMLGDGEGESLRDAYHEGALAAVDASGGQGLPPSFAPPLPGVVPPTPSPPDRGDPPTVVHVLLAVRQRGPVPAVAPRPHPPSAGP